MPDRLPKAQAGRDSGGWALHHKGCVSILVVACLMDQVLLQLYYFGLQIHGEESGLKQQLHGGAVDCLKRRGVAGKPDCHCESLRHGLSVESPAEAMPTCADDFGPGVDPLIAFSITIFPQFRRL